MTEAKLEIDKPLHFLSVGEASQLIARGELSPVALVEAFLARIEAVDGRVKSYITVAGDRALEAARNAEREIAAGYLKGPLHGIPFAVKDIYCTAGIRTTGGSRLTLDYVPDRSSTAVARLEAAGAILLGKLNTWEYSAGSGMIFHDLPFPVACNPWDLDRFTGGSSTGAGAGVAAGTAMFALGSDTGGSIRIPAAACGLQGLKPTLGRVSRARCIPNCWTLDHNGPLTWTVEDSAIVMQAIAGHDPDDPSSAAVPVPDFRKDLHAGVRGLVIGIITDFGPGAPAPDAPIAAALEQAMRVLESQGAIIREVKLPVPLADYWNTTRFINWSECYSMHEADFLERSHLIGRALREKLMTGFSVRAADYLAAMRLRGKLIASTDAVIRGCDILLLPGTFHVAPRYDEPETLIPFTQDTAMVPFNLTGHPAMVICTGHDSRGLPLNAQIVGNHFCETTVLRVAQAYESATPWRERRPEL